VAGLAAVGRREGAVVDGKHRLGESRPAAFYVLVRAPVISTSTQRGPMLRVPRFICPLRMPHAPHPHDLPTQSARATASRL
jgi:hypothetical protein